MIPRMGKRNSIIKGCRPDGTEIISVLCSCHLAVLNNGRVEAVLDKAELSHEFKYYKNISYKGYIRPSILKRDMDFYPWRENTDLVIQGIARSDQLIKEFNVKLTWQGEREKLSQVIIATGDRWVEKKHSLKLTEPEPFTEMPIRYDKAYGGTDEIAEKKYSDPNKIELIQEICGDDEDREVSEYSYFRNPSGKGYLIDIDGANELQFPNLEFQNDRLSIGRLVAPLNKWGERPYPACFDWFPHAWFPRCAFFCDFPETYNGKIPYTEVELGIFREGIEKIPVTSRPKHGFAQGSHPYLWRHRFQGDEEIRITHMSKDGRDFYVKLPNHVPKIKVRLFGGEVQQLQPMLDLVFIETEKDQVTLLWRGSTATKKDFIPPNWEDQCEYSVEW